MDPFRRTLRFGAAVISCAVVARLGLSGAFDPLVGWFETIIPEDRALARDYICDYHTPADQIHKPLICLAMSSVSKCCIIPIQDYLGLDNSCRINKPSTIGCNWRWRATEQQISALLQNKIRTVTLRYGRMNWDNYSEE